MARRDLKNQPRTAGLWEAEQLELQAYMDARLGALAVESIAQEPDWLLEAIEDAWPRVLAEAETACA